MILLRIEKKSVQKKAKCIDDQVLSNIMDDEEVLILYRPNSKPIQFN